MSIDLQRYQKHLDGVSRSFAFCIKELRGDFRQEVSLAYLLFRVLDSIEDYQWQSRGAQARAFFSFKDFLLNKVAPNEIFNWAQSFPPCLSTADKSLVNDSPWLFEKFHALKSENKQIFRKHLVNSARGMQYFQDKQNDSPEFRLHDTEELNAYCFFVAGIVGEFLSELYSMHNEKFHWIGSRRQSTHFGLFLQKINILKDQRKDEKQGRFFIPNRREIFPGLYENAIKSYAYIRNLPPSSDGYRLFCAWSFFLGLASLPHIQEGYSENRVQKISRLQTLELLAAVRWKLRDPKKLDEFFTSMLEPLKEICDQVKDQKDAKEQSLQHDRIFELYTGSLSSKDLEELRISLA